MIGIFDSGVGGMTVAHAIEKALPEYRLVYFGDLARTPYGSKSPETIQKYSRQNIEFLIKMGAKLIVIACNSAASVATEHVRESFSLPIFDVIEPAVKRVMSLPICLKKKARIGVIGTRATINSGIYPKKIAEACEEARIFSQECPLLVPLVEEGWLQARETKMIIRRYLSPLKRKQVTALVLGCTHYPLLKNLIQPRIGKNVSIIDSSEELAANLRTYLLNNSEFAEGLEKGGEHTYFVSDVTDAAVRTAKRIFGRDLELIYHKGI
jgi:glutamate racemase